MSQKLQEKLCEVGNREKCQRVYSVRRKIKDRKSRNYEKNKLGLKYVISLVFRAMTGTSVKWGRKGLKEAQHGNQKHRRESLNKKVKKCIFETESYLISWFQKGSNKTRTEKHLWKNPCLLHSNEMLGFLKSLQEELCRDWKEVLQWRSVQ